jgi:hypothetical protein
MQPAQTLPVYELKISLRGSNPAIWRCVQVPGSIQLNRLHDVFQVVMGWTDTTSISSLMRQLFTLCLQAMTTPAWSGLTNGVFAWLTSCDAKMQPLFTNMILATAGNMK